MSGSRPRILFISHSPHFGGAERCLYLLLKGLNRNKYDLSVLVPPQSIIGYRGQQDLGKLVAELDIPVYRTPIRWWVGRWPRYPAFAMGLPKRVAKVARFIRKKRIELVVSNSSVFVEGALAARCCGIPHVWHVLEMLEHDPTLRPILPLHQLRRLMASLSARIVAVSSAVSREFEPYVQPDKLRVVHTGVPEAEPQVTGEPKRIMFDLPRDTPVVAFIGLLSERKRAIDLVDAARDVLKKAPRTTFVIAGPDGGEAQNVIRRINEHGIGRSFRILGYRQDIPNILAASDMLVLPSLADPLPLAVMEAMSMGVPVVGTRSGGCEDLIVHGKTGYLVPSRSPASLAKAITALLESPKDRVQMGLAGHHRLASNFSYQQYIVNFEQLFDETAAAAQPASDSCNESQTRTIMTQLRSSALQQARHMAVRNLGFTQYREYAEVLARCLSLV